MLIGLTRLKKTSKTAEMPCAVNAKCSALAKSSFAAWIACALAAPTKHKPLRIWNIRKGFAQSRTTNENIMTNFLPNEQHPIIFCDAMPAMADVMTGSIPRPREPRKNESVLGWLQESPVWTRLTADDTPARAKWLPDIAPTQKTGLADFSYFFALHYEGESFLLAVNEEGTGYALASPFALLTDAWAALDRSNAGRPLSDSANPKTLAQRAWREKKKNPQ